MIIPFAEKMAEVLGEISRSGFDRRTRAVLGSECYYYFVEHQANPAAALQQLRQREFLVERYNR
jgi:hypothetical protein